MKKQFLFFILVIATQISFCQVDLSYNLPDSVTEKELINNIIENGDTIAYFNLIYYYEKYMEKGQMLPYSLIMANKWRYPYAMLDVYSILLSLYNCLFSKNIEIMDMKTRKLALEYLISYYENSYECLQKESIYNYDILKYVEKKYLKIIDGKIFLCEPSLEID